jgi:hypothetical protein
MSESRPRDRGGCWLLLGALAASPLGGLTGAAAPLAAQETPAIETGEPAAEREAPATPLFLGFEDEPAMDYGGRVVASAQQALSKAFAGIGDAGERKPALAPVWEFPVATFLLLVQHEVLGHGGRAREFGLSPSYGIGFLSASTSTARPPRDHQELALIAAGGTEADGVMAHRLLLDSLEPDGVDGSRLPLLLLAKLDFTIYVASAPRPRPGDDEGDFTHEYRHGNDIVIYLVGRQAQRLGGSAPSVWDGVYEPAFDERRLRDDWDQARVAALWNLLDPSLATSMWAYVRHHVLHGEERVRPAALWIGDDARLTLGTRAALGPEEISRFLDARAALPWGLLEVYVRDLDSGIDRTWGYGAAARTARFGPFQLALALDRWEQPRGATGAGDSRWNAAAEIELMGERWGAALKVGSKSVGFFPGLPADDGVYAGAGLLARW